MFYSPIPHWILSPSHLIYLGVSGKSNYRPISQWFFEFNFSQISYHYLNSSLLPLFCSVKNLVSLDLNANALEGPILCGFRNMTLLSYLDLSISRFGSTIPSCFYDAISIQITCKVLSQVP